MATPLQTTLVYDDVMAFTEADIDSSQRQFRLTENRTSNKTHADEINTEETTEPTSPTTTTTVGYIYIRGHRISKDHHTKPSKPIDPIAGQGLKPPGALHKEQMKKAQEGEDEKDVQASKRVADDPLSPKRSKKDHKTFYNYKLLHEARQVRLQSAITVKRDFLIN
jgi:hypothetical protein